MQEDGRPPYLERYIHAAIYEARPDVQAVVHAHAEDTLPFGIAPTPLVPVIHSGAFIGAEVPVWDIADSFGDATNLPFEAASFHAITSRFCLMFLPDIPRAAAEIVRVLKPGRWVAAMVWSAAERNPRVGLPMAAIKQVTDLPPPDPTAPGIFRLAKGGELAGMFETAGLVDVADQEFLGEWSYESAEQYYTSMMEIAAPVQNLMAKLSDSQRQQVKRLILEAAAQFGDGEGITFPIAVRVVAGRKPA